MCALAAVMFASCDEKSNGGNLDDEILDGFYVSGAATESTGITAAYMMTAGVNEDLMNTDKLSWDQSKRSGMFEKYVALKGNQDFKLLFYEAGSTVSYGAELTESELTGDGDQPFITIQKGELVIGEDAPAMRVPADGLYHIVLDLNDSQDLEMAQIVIAPVEWGIFGIIGWNGQGSWTAPTEVSDFNLKTMSWTFDFDELKNNEFKFAYGAGWKIQLDIAGKVKAHTNLGNNMKNGGDNIKPGHIYKNAKLRLTWNLKGAEHSKCYSWEVVEGEIVYISASDMPVGLAGDAFPGCTSWDGNLTDSKLVGVHNAEATVITDETKHAGSYVYDIKGINIEAGGFKVIIDAGGWKKFEEVQFSGDLIPVADGENAKVTDDQAGNYDVTITLDWTGEGYTAIKAHFKKNGEVVPYPETPVTAPETDLTKFPKTEGKITIYVNGTYATIWAWSQRGNLFAEWPGLDGTAVTIDEQAYTKFVFEAGDFAGANINCLLVGDKTNIDGTKTGDSPLFNLKDVTVLSVADKEITVVSQQ